MKKNEIKVAIVDLYNNEVNEGIRCIKEIVADTNKTNSVKVSFDLFETRYKNEIPTLEYDIFISSGGPGSPFEDEGKPWEKKYFNLLDEIWNNNQKRDAEKKHIFFICHSFQMMARHFKFADITEREYKSFGVLPILRTFVGEEDPLLKDLTNPYYAADFRRFQVVNQNKKIIKELDAEITSVEIVPQGESHAPALMAMKISDEIYGTQYHPEADAQSMIYHLKKDENKKMIVDRYNEARYFEMLDFLEQPDKIKLTRRTIIPTFLNNAIKSLTIN